MVNDHADFWGAVEKFVELFEEWAVEIEWLAEFEWIPFVAPPAVAAINREMDVFMEKRDNFFAAEVADAVVKAAFIAESETALFAAGRTPGWFGDFDFSVVLAVAGGDFVGLLAVLAGWHDGVD